MTQAQPEIGKVFHALGDPTRRAIAERLSRGPSTVSTLAAEMSISLTAVGQHMAILEAAGLAASHKLGRIRSCQSSREGFQVLEGWLKQNRTTLELQLDRLGEFLSQPTDEWLG